MLIQSALLNQLQLHSGQLKEKQSASGTDSSSAGGVSTIPSLSSSVANSSKEGLDVNNTTSSSAETSNNGSGKSTTSSTSATVVKEEPSASASLTLGGLLSSSKVTTQPTMVKVKQEKTETVMI